MDVEREREADWPHWPDRGSAPARGDRLEWRLFRDSELEAELERTQTTIRHLELAAQAKAVEVEELEQAVAETNGNHGPATDTHLVFVWTPHGYGLDVADGPAPEPGARVDVDGVERVVAKLGPSPLPGDERRCVYLAP